MVEAHHDITDHEILHDGLVKITEWVFLLISAHMAINGYLMHFWPIPVQVCASYSPQGYQKQYFRRKIDLKVR